MRDSAPVYLASFVVQGFALNMLGPALPTLRAQVDVSLGTIGILFTATAAGYLAGSLVGGIGYDRGLGHRLLAGAFVCMAGAFAFVPLVHSLAALCVGFVLMGLAAGTVDVGGNTLMVWARSPHVGPLMNALHFAFGFGALLCPILVNRSLVWSDNVAVAFWTVSALALAVAVFALVSPAPEPRVAKPRSDNRPPTRLLAVIAGFYLLYVGLELSFGGWIYTYGEVIGIGGRNAPALLTSTFWGAFTIGRLLAVPASHRFAPGPMLAATAVCAIGSAAVLVAGRGDSAAVWIGTAALGIGMGPQFATMMTYADEQLGLTSASTSWFVAASALGGLGFPWLIGQLFERIGAAAMPAAVLVVAVLVAGWMAVIHRLARAYAH